MNNIDYLNNLIKESRELSGIEEIQPDNWIPKVGEYVIFTDYPIAKIHWRELGITNLINEKDEFSFIVVGKNYAQNSSINYNTNKVEGVRKALPNEIPII